MSRLPFELLLALRYLRPKRTFVSVITLISIIGVMLGVAVLIIVISVMTGFDQQLREKILGFSAHLKVFPAGDANLTDYVLPMSVVASNQNVKGVAPFVLAQVLVETEPETGQPRASAPWVRGIDASLETKVSNLPTTVEQGEFDLSGHGLLIGSEFARGMDLRVGDRVAITSPRDLQRMRKKQGKEEVGILPEDYTVRGIFEMGYYDYDATVIVTSLENAQDLYDLGESVHGLLVRLNDPYQADAVRKQLHQALGGNYRISIWTEENSAILDALLVEKNVMFYLLFFIMIVAAFGITSALITFVVQKTREIGMLKALGASSGQVMALFLSQSLLVGVIGVIAGFGLGMLAIAYRNEFLHFMNRMTGFELFPASIYKFTELPALIVRSDIAIICGGSLIICLLAGLLPAWNAGRLKPVEALRHE